MKSLINSLATSVLLSAFLSTIGFAQDVLSTEQLKASPNQSSTAVTDIEQLLAANEALLASERAQYEDYFAQAYAQYPALPKGILEAVAFVQSRWVNLEPNAYLEPHQHIPRAYGVMGLYHGDGFRDQVAQAARLIGSEEQEILHKPLANILAAAALLNELLPNDGKGTISLEAMAPILAEYAGFAAVKDSQIQSYARDNFSYDVLLSLDRGFDDHGIKVPEKPIAWEQAFSLQRLVELRAPFVRLDVKQDRVVIDGYQIDPISETLIPTPFKQGQEKGQEAGDSGDTRSTDYGPALYVQSPYHTTRSSSITQVTVHTMEGSYAGTISWFQNNPYSVSAHYLVRSSDGQITQMVRESRRAHHVGVHNNYTLGIEHEGFVANGSSWYTTAMYNASSALTKHFCSVYGISCAAAYSGPAHSGVVVLSTSIPIKGHQHYSSNTHVDPGIFWDWSRYHGLLNGGSGGGGGASSVLDTFESSEGHFTNTPAYSGSTTGISTSSTADRTCSISRNGNCSEQIRLIDNTSTSASWAVRFLSGGGSPGANTSFNRNGRIGFWVYTGGSGMSVGIGIDDSDGTERSTSKSIPANSWTFVEWNLTSSAQWSAWVGGNGAISATNVTIDAIWLYRAQTSFDVYVYLDDVTYTAN